MYCRSCVKLIRPDHTGLQCTALCTRIIGVADVLSVLCKAHQTRSHWLTVYCALHTNRTSTPNLTHSAQLITLDPKVRHYHDPVSRLRKGLTVKILHAFLPFSSLLVLSQDLRFPCVASIV